MENRYLITVNEIGDTGLVRILAVEQKSGKVWLDAVLAKELEDEIRNLFANKFGIERIYFVDKGTSNPPSFSEFPTN
ncbi:MAG: hypothetical protein U0V74_01390 [Chitinophagales bacterium]